MVIEGVRMAICRIRNLSQCKGITCSGRGRSSGGQGEFPDGGHTHTQVLFNLGSEIWLGFYILNICVCVFLKCQDFFCRV